MARTVVAHMILTLDGVVKFDAVHAAIMEHIDEQVDGDSASKIAEEDAMLLGRKTYEEWLHFWPDSDIEPFASHINGVPKYVVSRTLTSVTWPTKGKAHLLSGDLREGVLALKNQPGKNIGVHGSPTLVGSLIKANCTRPIATRSLPRRSGEGRAAIRGRLSTRTVSACRFVDEQERSGDPYVQAPRATRAGRRSRLFQ